jgi:hypothetical protein
MKPLQTRSIARSTGLQTSGSAAIKDFSPAEKKAYEGLSSDLKRGIFLTNRGWAAGAAEKGKTTYPGAQDRLASEHHCSQRHASRALREFQRLDYIKMTALPDPLNGKAAEYRWNLPTTLAIPAYTGQDIEPGNQDHGNQDQDQDQGEEEVLDL